MLNNIIVTAANNIYYDTLCTLISSVHKHSYNFIDSIVVYDIGLDSNQKDMLSKISKVTIKTFDLKLPFADYLNPKGHAYKCFCLYNEKQYARNILWLDAGVMLLQNVEEIFNIIDKEDIFLVGDVHLNKNYTKKKCIEIMKATESEINDVQLSSGILGYKSKGKYQKLIDEAFNYSTIAECVLGDEENHRHDQSIYSILASRFKCKKYDIDRYGYWTNSVRNLNTALYNNAVIFVHRRGHHDIKDIIYS